MANAEHIEIVKNVRVSIIKILEELNNLNDVEEKIIKINLFLDFIEFNFKNIDIDYINNLIIYFIKKINKYKISNEKIKKINKLMCFYTSASGLPL